MNQETTQLAPRSSQFAIVLVVSCAHAVVHLTEQSFASVEQVVSGEFGLSQQQSGALGSALRLPFGFGAVITGILADRLGASRILTLYLAGVAVVCGSFVFSATPSILWVQLFLLGVFASMYHPAGLSLLTTITTPQSRAKSLGMHGVFGSLGLAAAPAVSFAVLLIPGTTWRTFFLVVASISGVLVFLFRAGIAKYGVHSESREPTEQTDPAESHEHKDAATSGTVAARSDHHERSPERLQVWPFSVLMISSAFSGVVYGGFLHFLTRYLSEIEAFDSLTGNRDSIAMLQSSLVLVCGMGGQWISGHFATPRRLAGMLSVIYLTNVPLFCWMSTAHGLISLVPCCLLAFVHFMNQPVYNSLLPDYLPLKTRSTWFGFSQMMTFGVGALGPYLVGSFRDFRNGYFVLAGLSLLAGLLPMAIWAERRRRFETSS